MKEKKKNSKLLIQYSLFGVATAALVGGVIYARKRKEQGLPLLPVKEAQLPALPLPANVSSKPSYVNNAFPLRKWMKGSLVRQLQQALNAKGQSISVDGYWGQQTQRAVVALGIATPINRTAFGLLVGKTTAPSSQTNLPSSGDVPSSSVSENAKNLAVSAAVSAVRAVPSAPIHLASDGETWNG